jgi:hypothetical protein
MFSKFGNSLTLNQNSYIPKYPEQQAKQDIPFLEADIFDGFSARRRPEGVLPGMNVNPMLNKMHET